MATSPGGGAGGGALLVACNGTATISGKLSANGGNGAPVQVNNDEPAGGGSGGGIRIVAQALAGNGTIECVGGRKGTWGNPGGLGRVRLERVVNENNLQVTPDPSLVNLADGATPLIWLPADGPTVRIVSIEGQEAPADPRAGFGTIGADIVLPQVTNVTVVVETANVDLASVVRIRATPRANGNFTETTNTTSRIITEDPLVIRWMGNVPVQDGYAAIQAHVVRP